MSAIDDYLGSFDLAPGYLDWAAFGPLSPSVRAQSAADLDLFADGRASSIARVGESVAQSQQLIAELIGVEAADVTLQPSSTQALMHALYGLSGTVIAGAGEFPSVSLTLHRAATASRGDLVPRWLAPADGRITTDAVADALDEEVTALVVSHVDFRTGYRVDLAGLRALIGPHRLLIVDAVQSFGVVDDDYAAADVVVGHAYKWMRAGRGTAFARFAPRARERIVPLLSGRTGTPGNRLPVDELPAAAASAQAFTVSAPDTFAPGRLAAGLRDVRDAGVATIESRLADNVDRVLEIVDRAGIAVVSSRDRARRAGIVSLAPEDPAGLSAALADAGVAVTTRGAAIRIAPHAGTDADTLQLLDEALTAFGNETFISA